MVSEHVVLSVHERTVLFRYALLVCTDQSELTQLLDVHVVPPLALGTHVCMLFMFVNDVHDTWSEWPYTYGPVLNANS